MAEIITSTQSGNRRKQHSLKVDMTPMVDLGFLLITFFIFTSSMSEQKAMKLFMPADGVPSPYKESAAITVLLGGDKEMYYYEGTWQEAYQQGHVRKTSFDVQRGLGKAIRDKQMSLGQRKNELMLLIKPGETSTYADIINALDVVSINDMKRYAIAPMEEGEKAFLLWKSR